MKLTTAMMLGAFALVPTYTLAGDHRDHDGHSGHHGKACKHHHAHTARHEYRDKRDAANYGRVLDVEPVYRYYKEPVNARSCLQYDHGRPTYTSHTATVLGAVIGGALGHRIGDSHGDPTAAAVAGGLLGASVGRDIDRRASDNRALLVEGPCRVGRSEQTRRQLVEYRVRYRYNGEVHVARMDYHPGDWVKLDVDVTPA